MSVELKHGTVQFEDIPRVVNEPASVQTALAVAILILCVVIFIAIWMASGRRVRAKPRHALVEKAAKTEQRAWVEPVKTSTVSVWCARVLPFRNIVLIDADNRVHDFTAYANDVFEARLGSEIAAKELILMFESHNEDVVRIRLRDASGQTTWEYHGRLQPGKRTQFFLSADKLTDVFSNIRRPDTEIYETLRYNHTGRGAQDEYNEKRLARIVHA